MDVGRKEGGNVTNTEKNKMMEGRNQEVGRTTQKRLEEINPNEIAK